MKNVSTNDEITHNSIIYIRRHGEMSLNINNHCASACKFCIKNVRKNWNSLDLNGEDPSLYLKRDPTFFEIRKALEQYRVKFLTFPSLIKICGYGEPLLRPEAIYQILDYFKSQKAHSVIQITTQGFPYYAIPYRNEVLPRFRDGGVRRMNISLSFLDKNQYLKMVRPMDQHGYEKTLDFIQLASSAGFEIIVSLIDMGLIDEVMLEEFKNRFRVNIKVREIE